MLIWSDTNGYTCKVYFALRWAKNRLFYFLNCQTHLFPLWTDAFGKVAPSVECCPCSGTNGQHSTDGLHYWQLKEGRPASAWGLLCRCSLCSGWRKRFCDWPRTTCWAAFPSGQDTHDEGAWETVVSELAQQAGVSMAVGQAQLFGSRHHTYLSQRFD